MHFYKQKIDDSWVLSGGVDAHEVIEVFETEEALDSYVGITLDSDDDCFSQHGDVLVTLDGNDKAILVHEKGSSAGKKPEDMPGVKVTDESGKGIDNYSRNKG